LTAADFEFCAEYHAVPFAATPAACASSCVSFNNTSKLIIDS